MKLQGADRQIVSNVDNSHKFTIQNNAKMFEILSSRIYTYKTAALVREISWNAHDSHIEAGKADVPFRVVLPNDMHPYFEVEDFGVGLDETGVKEIYTQYGNSTKGNSNEVVGAFGLGSKTPFAYTKSFTIQTRKDGREYLFNAYLGNGGEPTVSLTRARDTDKENGVKIKVPVKAEDFDSFYNEASFILSFFPVRPEVVAGNAFEFDFTPAQISNISNDKVTCLNTQSVRSSLYRNHKLFAVMGGVCYPVKMSDINLSYETENYVRSVILSDTYSAIFVSFDIGELDVNAAREGLSIDEGSKTEKMLEERFLDAIHNSIKADQENLNKCQHPMEAIRYIINNYGDIVRLTGNMFEYKGKSISTWSYRSVKSQILKGFGGTLKKSSNMWSRRKTPDFIHDITLYELINTKFIVVYPESEKTKGLEAKAKRWARRNHRTLIIYFNEPMSQKTLNKFYAMYQITPYKQITFEEIAEIEREERRANMPQDSKAQNLAKKKNTEISTRGFKVEAGNTSYFKNRRVDVSDTDYDYYWVDPAGSGLDKSFIEYTDDEGVTKTFAASQLDYANKFTARRFKILIKNTINKKSIEENDVPYISELIDELKENYVDKFKTVYLASKLFMESKIDNNICLTGQYSILEAMYKSNSVLLLKEAKDFYDDAKANQNDYLQYCSSSIDSDFFSIILDDEFEDMNNFLDRIEDSQMEAKKRYPLLEYVSLSSLRWNYSDERKMDLVSDYMVDVDTAKEYTKLTDNAA